MITEPEKYSSAGPGVGPDSSVINDIFSSIFGEDGFNPFGPRSKQADHYNVTIKLGFIEACLGGTRRVSFSAPDPCGDCGGTGGVAESKAVCSDCNGAGVTRKGGRGNMVFSTTCRKCSGKGSTFSSPCPKCSGKGRIPTQRQHDIFIPAGALNGAKLRVPGLGSKSADGRDGDLIITIMVEAHPTMRNDGANIVSSTEISLKSALLGCEIDVETIYGPVKMKIPPCTSSGRKFSIKEKGIRTQVGVGNHIVIVNVKFPESLTQEQQEQISNIL